MVMSETDGVDGKHFEGQNSKLSFHAQPWIASLGGVEGF